MENIVEFLPESVDRSDDGWPKDLRSDVDRITPYPCQTCKQLFQSCERLANHHCWECTECTLVYRTSSGLNAHVCVPIENKKKSKTPRGRYGRKAFSDVA